MKLDKENSKKQKKASGLSKIIKRGVVIVLAVGTVVVGGIKFAYSYIPNNEKDLASLLTEYKEEQVYTNINGSDDLCLIYDLENNMNLDNILANMDLKSYTEGLNSTDSSSYTKEEINALIEEYSKLRSVDKKTPSNNSIRFYQIAAILNDYNNNFSSALNINSLTAINNISEMIIKTSIIEGLKLDMSCIDNLSTNLTDLNEPFKCMYIDPTTGKKFELELSTNNNFNSLVREVRKLNELFAGKKDKSGNVIETDENKIIKQQKKVLNAIKYSLGLDCKVEDGIISEENNIIKAISSKMK